MIRINQLKLAPGHSAEELEKKIRKILRLKEREDFTYEIAKCSIDARKKPEIYLSYTIDVRMEKTEKERNVVKRSGSSQVSVTTPISYHFPAYGEKKLRHRPVVIGTGPAGLFCGYMLALHGYRPVLLERGRDADSRLKDVRHFWESGELNTESNVQFGEGGAGTFSDGKLNTLVKDKDGRNKKVLSLLVEAGAPESILYEGKPHIGTDILIEVVKNMRRKIIEYGGQVCFETKVTDIITGNGSVMAVMANGQRIETGIIVLAVGHSARDTFEMLHQRQIPMEAKSFAVGLRVEHPQRLVNLSQYGSEKPAHLPPAAYKLTARTESGRGVYSFCMCPGGYVVDASTEEGRLAVNGMSYSRRDGENANSAIIVSVTPEDYGSYHPLAGIAFQRKLEEKAYAVGEGRIPVEYYGEFKRALGRKPDAEKAEREELSAGRQENACNSPVWEGIEELKPCIKGRFRFGPVHEILPGELNLALIEGMEQFERSIPGFASDKAVLSGVESRTSSPVRIHRDKDGQSALKGLYPCGEGAGYAGGITSAAMDGIRIAELIASKYRPFSE